MLFNLLIVGLLMWVILLTVNLGSTSTPSISTMLWMNKHMHSCLPLPFPRLGNPLHVGLGEDQKMSPFLHPIYYYPMESAWPCVQTCCPNLSLPHVGEVDTPILFLALSYNLWQHQLVKASPPPCHHPNAMPPIPSYCWKWALTNWTL